MTVLPTCITSNLRWILPWWFRSSVQSCLWRKGQWSGFWWQGRGKGSWFCIRVFYRNVLCATQQALCTLTTQQSQQSGLISSSNSCLQAHLQIRKGIWDRTAKHASLVPGTGTNPAFASMKKWFFVQAKTVQARLKTHPSWGGLGYASNHMQLTNHRAANGSSKTQFFTSLSQQLASSSPFPRI